MLDDFGATERATTFGAPTVSAPESTEATHHFELVGRQHEYHVTRRTPGGRRSSWVGLGPVYLFVRPSVSLWESDCELFQQFH